MFRDDYKSVNNNITASSELKKRTLEKINTSKESKFVPYMRYGLICASFLFVVATFPVLYGLDGITNDKSAQLMANGQVGETMPQTGVDESVFESAPQSQEAVELDENPKELLGISNPLGGESKSEEKPLQQSQIKKDVEQKAQVNDDVQTKKLIDEISKVESAVSEKFKMFTQLIPADKINFNELNNTTVQSKLSYPVEEGYYEELWNDNQVADYLGISPIPSYIPEDLTMGWTESELATQKVIFNKDATIAYGAFSYYFCEPQLTREFNPTRRTLSVTVAKDKLPIDCAIYMNDDATISTIKGNEIKLGMLKVAYQYDEKKEPTAYFERYVAEFILNSVGYRIISDNLTQKEFTDVISSIISPISD